MSEEKELPEPYKTLVEKIGERVPFDAFSALLRILTDKGVITKAEVRSIFSAIVDVDTLDETDQPTTVVDDD